MHWLFSAASKLEIINKETIFNWSNVILIQTSLLSINCATKRIIILDVDVDFCSLTAKSAVTDRHRQRSEFARTDSRDLIREVYSGIELISEWNKG